MVAYTFLNAESLVFSLLVLVNDYDLHFSVPVLQELLESQRSNLRRVKDRLVEIEKAVFSSRVHLEEIRHQLDQKGRHSYIIRTTKILLTRFR